MSYDTYKLRSDMDDLARNHALQPDDFDDWTKCATCGGWIRPDEDAHIKGFKDASNVKEWDCSECYSQRPEVIAAREVEAALDRKDGK